MLTKKKILFALFIPQFFFFCFSSWHVMTLDYSDENGNVSGGESEDDGRKNEEHKEHRHSQDNEISTTASHHDHNEIEKSTSIEETTTTMKMEPRRNHSMPCDADNGGCDHECRMVIDEHDVDPRIQCSCYIGYTLDENDGRRCHGKINFSTSFHSSFFTIDIQSLLFLFILTFI